MLYNAIYRYVSSIVEARYGKCLKSAEYLKQTDSFKINRIDP